MQEGKKFGILRKLIEYKELGWEFVKNCKSKRKNLCSKDFYLISPSKVKYDLKEYEPVYTEFEHYEKETVDLIFLLIKEYFGVERKISFS